MNWRQATKVGLGVLGAAAALAGSAYLSVFSQKQQKQARRKAAREFASSVFGQVLRAKTPKVKPMKLAKGKVFSTDHDSKPDYSCKIVSIGGQPMVI